MEPSDWDSQIDGLWIKTTKIKNIDKDLEKLDQLIGVSDE